MRLPDIQARLRAKAVETGDLELKTLADAISRRKPVTKAPIRSRRMNDYMRRRVIMLHLSHPQWSQQRIAEALGINAGRVSETLAGFRY